MPAGTPVPVTEFCGRCGARVVRSGRFVEIFTPVAEEELAQLRREFFGWTWAAIGYIAAARRDADMSRQIEMRARNLYVTMEHAASFTPEVQIAWDELGGALEARQ